MATPTYIPIASITLGSSASSVEFSSIPQGYRDLVLVFNGRSSYTPNAGDDLVLRFNNDTGNNYSTVIAEGGGGTTFSESYTRSEVTVGKLATSTSSNTDFSQAIANIMDYSATDKHKTLLGRGDNAALGGVSMSAGRYASNSAITSVSVFSVRDLQGFSSDFVAGSTFALYGIEA